MRYKVPQNVEVEDKVIGPLTLKQFIYLLVAFLTGIILFRILPGFLFVIIGFPIVGLFLAFGLLKINDQPFERFFLSFLAYFTRPRFRFWVKEPEEPKIEVTRINPHEKLKEVTPPADLTEIHNQLEKLSRIVDTRGWEEKEATVQEPVEPPVSDIEDRVLTKEKRAQIIKEEIGPLSDILEVPVEQKNHVNSLLEDVGKKILDKAHAKMERIREARVKRH